MVFDTNKPLKVNFQEVADPRELSYMEKLLAGLVNIYQAIKGIKIDWPRVFPVMGEVDINRIKQMPPVQISNLADLRKSIDELHYASINAQKALSGLKINMPESFRVENEVKIKEWGELIDRVEETNKGLNLILNKEGKGKHIGPMEVSITNFPPTMVPTPVSHISLNSLSGFAHTTSATVTSSLTPLPTYGVLDNRRSLIIYNNSSNTIYLGGSTVTTSSGMPVPPSSYSPIFDAGIHLIIYGIAESGNNNVRVLELSDEASGR